MCFRLETTYHGWWGQYNLGTTNTDFKMFGIQANFGIFTARIFLCRLCTYSLSWLFTEHDVAWNSHVLHWNFRIPNAIMFCFFELYYINNFTLIIRVIRLRLRNAICGSNFSEKKYMRLKNNWFPALRRYKTHLWICYLQKSWMVLTDLWTHQTGSLFV